MDRLKFAIEQNQQGATFIHELIRAWHDIPVPVLTDLGSIFLRNLRDSREIIQLLAQDKGRTWLKVNLDNMVDCLFQLSQRVPKRHP